MIKDIKKELVNAYLEKANDNLADIRQAFETLGIDHKNYLSKYKKILAQSAEYVSSRWLRGEKYTRTEFVLRAFGPKYPEEVLSISLSMDAMINILDDLLDENLDPEIKKLFVIEYLRVFASYNVMISNLSTNKNVSVYFNKLIMLAVFENEILNEFSQAYSIKKMVPMALKLSLSRAQDIDIFVQLATEKMKISNNKKDQLMRSARHFRAMNILKKDILDIEHDNKNGQKTLVTVAKSRGVKFFREFIRALCDEISKGALTTLSSTKGGRLPPSATFYDMLKREQEAIEKML